MATTKTIQSRQQQKYSTSTEWSNANPTLLQGEIAVVKIGNSYRFKVGDGTSKYNALPFVDEGALADKVDKYTSTSYTGQSVYAISSDGSTVTQKMINTDGMSNTIDGTIPLRITNGNIPVPETPTNNTDAASKKYVDDAVAGAGGGSSLRTATYVIASSDSLDDAKNAADLVIQTTEDTAAKLAAITFTADGPNSGTYYFAPGTYYIRSDTLINCPGTYSFVGYGADIMFSDNPTGNSGFAYFGIQNSQQTANTFVNIEGFNLYGSDSSIGICINANYLGVAHIHNCQFNQNIGVRSESQCDLYIDHCKFSTNIYPIQLQGSLNLTTAIARRATITNNYFVKYDGYEGAIYIAGSYTSTIIANNVFKSESSIGYAIYFASAATQVSDINISNNICYTSKFIWSSASTTRTWNDVHISNNISYPNAVAHDICLYGIFTDVVISDNKCPYGIKLLTRGSTSINLTVKGNIVSSLSMHAGYENQTYGSFKNVVITGNLITGQHYSNIGGSRLALNKGSIIDGNSIYRYHSTKDSSSKDDAFFVSGDDSESWASTSQVMFGNNIDNA